MSARATAIWRRKWGWRIRSQESSLTCMAVGLSSSPMGLSFGLLTAWQPWSPQSQWSERETEATVFLEPSLGSYLPSFLLYSVGHRPTLTQCRRELPKGTNIREAIYWRLPWRLPITQTKEHQGRPPTETKSTGRTRIGVSVPSHSSWRFIRSSSPVH